MQPLNGQTQSGFCNELQEPVRHIHLYIYSLCHYIRPISTPRLHGKSLTECALARCTWLQLRRLRRACIAPEKKTYAENFDFTQRRAALSALLSSEKKKRERGYWINAHLN